MSLFKGRSILQYGFRYNQSISHKQIYELLKLPHSLHLRTVELFHQIRRIIIGGILMQLEILAILLTNVLTFDQLVQVLLQSTQLEILTLIERKNRDAVISLHRIRIGRVIHKHSLRQISIYLGQILYEEVSRQLPTMLSVQSMVEQHTIWIQFVQDSIRVVLMAGSEDYDFPALLHPLKEGDGVRTDIDANFKGKPINLHGEGEICSDRLASFEAVDERLIKVQNECLFIVAVFQDWEIDFRVIFEQSLLVKFAQPILQVHLNGLTDVVCHKRSFILNGSHAFADVIL